MEKTELTVAMSVCGDRDIAWLPMESLVCQHTPLFYWELVVCEEKHEKQCGEQYFTRYLPWLKRKACTKIKYLETNEGTPLSSKWRKMGEEASPDSTVFLMQEADCWSFSSRVFLSYYWVCQQGYNWYDVRKGYFYNIPSGRLVRINKKAFYGTHLNIAFNTEAARSLPEQSTEKKPEEWIFDHCRKFYGKKFKRYLEEKTFPSLKTDEGGPFGEPECHFEETDKKLDQLDLPMDVVKMLESMK